MSIAIVGMQGVFPDAGNVDVLWQNIRSGKISIPSFAPTVEEKPGETWVHRCPLLNNPQWFDAAFFGYSDIEAEALDPQLRMLMEQAWLVLEQAGGGANSSSACARGFLPVLAIRVILNSTFSIARDIWLRWGPIICK